MAWKQTLGLVVGFTFVTNMQRGLANALIISIASAVVWAPIIYLIYRALGRLPRNPDA